ncbi:MAG: hypothetical protein BRD35_09250 [Bacteroidetes bacterium QH_7_62_13]|nr:MAG: hypothetical protein BRD35_09250 [Bacteroidetes bacterium QH_7_62_13]
MGQQQLLLLVLSTVIVGLATVAGIQAFSENQAQASQDALVQRGTAIASDIQGLAGRPEQMGGVDLSSGKVKGADVADALGYETTGNKKGKQVKADGAGSSGTCTIQDQSKADEMTVKCTSNDAPKDVSVTVNPSNANDGKSNTDAITTSFS